MTYHLVAYLCNICLNGIIIYIRCIKLLCHRHKSPDEMWFANQPFIHNACFFIHVCFLCYCGIDTDLTSLLFLIIDSDLPLSARIGTTKSLIVNPRQVCGPMLMSAELFLFYVSNLVSCITYLLVRLSLPAVFSSY